MAAKSKQLVTTFTKERDTKNKVRFQEDEEPFAIDKLYVSKKFLKELGDPENLKVTIEPV